MNAAPGVGAAALPVIGGAAGLSAAAAALPAALLLLALAFGAAFLAATEWSLWRAVWRAGLRAAPGTSFGGWAAGPAVPLPAAPRSGERPSVAVGFAMVVASVVFAAGVLALGARGSLLPAGLGAVAIFPLGGAIGYAVAAERARSPEAARHRFDVAGRILLASPGWIVAVALWAHGGGGAGPALAAGATGPLWRSVLGIALVWSGLFILPGTVAEAGPTGGVWGGDAREESQVLRLLSAAAHYAALAVVCLLAGSVFAGRVGAGRELAGGVVLAVGLALGLRMAASVPRAGAWVREGPQWMVPALLLLSLAISRAAAGAA